MKKEYKEKFYNWVTTIHGIPNLFRTNNSAARVFWTLAVLICLSFCCYTIVKSVAKYQKFETYVSNKLVREIPTNFPAVTICNLNPFDYENNVDYFNGLLDNYNISYVEYLVDPFIETIWLQDEQIKDLKQFSAILKRLVASDNSLNDSMRHEIGFSLSDYMLLSCTYNQHECNSSNFNEIWNDNYGNCFTFNGKSDFLQYRDGPEYGLELELLIANPNRSFQITDQQGLYVIIHDNNASPFVSGTGINVPSGSATYLPITRTLTQKLSNPYSNCLEELAPFSDHTKQLYGYMSEIGINEYNSEFCYKLCIQDKIIEECNCSDISVAGGIGAINICNSQEELLCLTRINEFIFASNSEELCDSACPIECNRMKYNVLDQKSIFPTDFYLTQLMLKASIYHDKDGLVGTPYERIYNINELYQHDRAAALRNLRDAIVKVRVNYDDLRYTHIQESPLITFELFLGIIGGQLALFMGLSFLSFMELFQLLFELVGVFLKRRSGMYRSRSPTVYTLSNSQHLKR